MADQTFAVNCGFFDAINSDRVYSADEMNRPYKRVISNGVFATPSGTPSTDLQVTASSGMNIICKKGEGLFGDKWFENPSGIVITVPSNTGTVPRIDSVLVQVDTRTSGRVGNIVHRTGTPSSSPVPPAINQVEGVIEYRLANIRVNAGVSAITQSMITDRRGSSDCPWVTSLIYQVDTSTLYDQWQAAYAEYFEEEKAVWDAWYAQLTEDLDVSMTLDRHVNTVTTDAQTTGYIPIGLAYNHNTDILEVYINGLRAVEGTHYVVADDTTILVENQLQIGQEVTFVVMRSVISGSATNIMVLLQELESQIAGIAGGTPTVVDAKADMTEHGKIYILSTDSKWYYYSTTASDWLAGGTYGGAPTDTTLSISGSAADAKAVGDALAEKADSSDVTALEGSIEAIEDALEDKADKSDLENLDMVQIADDFSASKTYAIGDYVVYNKKLYRCITAITTAGAWDSAKWIEISVMGDLGSRLDMLVTMQEIHEEEDESTSEIVQLINSEWITWQTVSWEHRAKISQRIPLKGNGAYYDNPYRAENTDPVNSLNGAKFYNAFGEPITFTKQGAAETRTSFQLFTTYGCRFEISDGNILTLYVRSNEVSGVWVGDSEIAYMGADAGHYIYFGLTEERNVGITYGGYSTTYVPYEGSAPVITHEYQYVPAMAEYVQRYMQIYGTAVSNAMFKRYYPDEDKTLAVNAFRYWHDRAERENRGVIRVANFNKFVSRQSGNWSVIKQELADYSVDICGFEEALNITLNNKRLEEYLQGYQFTSGSDHDITGATECGKALVSHWEVDSTTVLSLVTTGSGVQYALKCVMTIPSGKWFSNFVDSDCTLSVYVWHGISTNATVDGVSKTSLEIRQMEITALLAIMAQDTSDFIVVVADTNCFETGLDIQNNTHVEWEMFRTAEYIPVLPGIESTVTADVSSSHFHVDGNGTAFCDACYDQIFIGSNITAEGYKVVDSNLYPVPAANNAPVSDHCMIYADLVFDFDAVMQEKLIAEMGV